ncbi:MAG: transposase, partial [Candidatus Tectomicrobia bacterium]|nr:transposase [Candidatus Tectomicrobia bacterium]
DTLGHLLAVHLTAADAQDRAHVAQLAKQVQEVTGHSVDLACVDQGDTGDHAAQDAASQGRPLDVVNRPEARNGFVLLPRRGVVERSFAWAARVRRLARDDERLPKTLAGLHVLAFAMLMLTRFVALMAQSA